MEGGGGRGRRGKLMGHPNRAAVFACLFACFFSLTACAPGITGRQGFAMDTVVSLTAYGKDAAAAMDAALAELAALEARLSVTRGDSEVAKINENAGELVSVSPQLQSILETSLTVSRQSGGAFDISVYPLVKAWGFTTETYRVPEAEEIAELLPAVDYTKIRLEGQSAGVAAGMAIDLGAVAKGYAGDALAEVYAAHGVRSGIINLGGNVRAVGEKPGGQPWRIAIQDPYKDAGNACILEVRDANVITSGAYQRYFERDGVRYHHIIDPGSGRPSDSGLASVTIVAAGGAGAMADATATALFVMGLDDGLAYWRNYGGFEAVLITEDGAMVVTPGIADQIRDVAAGFRYSVADGK